MNEDRFDQDLRGVLRDEVPARAPDALVRRVASIPDAVVPARRAWFTLPRALTLAASIGVVAVAGVLVLVTASHPPVVLGPTSVPTAVAQSPSVVSPSPVPTPSPTASPTAAALARYVAVPVTFPSIAGGSLSVAGVASANGVLVAVGSGTDHGEAVVLTSQDGRSWQRVTDQAAFHDTSGSLAMTGVAAGSNGRIVAVGRLTPTSGAARMAAWWSDDARSWHRVADTTAFAAGNPEAGIVATDQGFAVAGERGKSPAAWVSREGVVWSLARTPAGPSGARLVSLAAGGPGLVAIGAPPAAAGTATPAANRRAPLWTSTDGGQTWADDPGAPNQVPSNDGGLIYSYTALACSPDRCVAGAAVDAGNGGAFAGISLVRWYFNSSDALRWQGTDVSNLGTGPQLDQVAWNGAAFVASGDHPGGGGRLAWASLDGRTWHEIALPGAASSASWGRLVAAGKQVFALPPADQSGSGSGGAADQVWLIEAGS